MSEPLLTPAWNDFARDQIRQLLTARKRAARSRPKASNPGQNARKPKDPVRAFVNKEVRLLFFRVIASVYWQELCEHAKSQRLGVTTIADRLGLVGSTKSRWVRGLVDSGAEKFFATLLLVMNQPLSRIPHATNPVLLRKSVLTAIERTATDFCSHPKRAMTDRALFVVGTMMRTRAADAFVPGKGPKTPAELIGPLQEIATAVGHALDQRAATEPNYRTDPASIHTPGEVYQIVHEWALPFAVLCLAVLPSWRVFDA